MLISSDTTSASKNFAMAKNSAKFILEEQQLNLKSQKKLVGIILNESTYQTVPRMIGGNYAGDILKQKYIINKEIRDLLVQGLARYNNNDVAPPIPMTNAVNRLTQT